jgi:hypothetical protein
VQHTTSWHLEVLLYEDGDRTRAEAVLRTSAGTELRSEGIARRNPKDTDVPEIGETGHLSGPEWARTRSVRGDRYRYRAERTPPSAPRVVRPCRFTISGKRAVFHSVRADRCRVGAVVREDALGSIELVCDRRRNGDIEMILVAYATKYGTAAQIAERRCCTGMIWDTGTKSSRYLSAEWR